ncbi:MAG: hypothetical protein AAF467_09295 [Actinomycetota bacterium]
MTRSLTFLPWLRRGISVGLASADPGGASPIDRLAPVDVWVDVDGTRVSADARVRPPDHARAIDPAQIVRRVPGPGAVNVETGYWPLIEFISPDLCWALTPVAPEPQTNRLRPWIVLICVPTTEAELIQSDTTEPPSLVVDAAFLPSLSQSALWAHVQSALGAELGTDAAEVAAATREAADTSPGTVISRLLCPVTLEPDTQYRAAVVNAFHPDGDQLQPAWSGSGQVTLTVFDTWTFSTGQASSFQDLVSLLGPVDDLDLDLGLRSVDVSKLGPIEPWSPGSRVSATFAGPLVDPNLDATDDPDQDAAVVDAIVPFLDQGSQRVVLDADAPDPIVTPPLYGSFVADEHAVPKKGWMREVNTVLRHRMAAGLGADIVRVHQERFMAAAWRQAGQIREARRALNAMRLQAEIARTWKARTDRLDPDAHATVARAQYSTLRVGNGRPARHALRGSGIPTGLHSPALARLSRPGSRMSRSLLRRFPPPPRPDDKPSTERHPTWRQAVGAMLATSDRRRQVRFATGDAPPGALLTDGRLAIRLGVGTANRGSGARRPWRDQNDVLDLGEVVGAARAVSPQTSTLQRAQARVPGLDTLVVPSAAGGDEVPTRISLGPDIDEALMWSLLDRSVDLVMPGASAVPNNSVRLVRSNAEFVAAFLAGANHEMARELLWREYPADLSHTVFRRFWDRRDGRPDVHPMLDWPASDSLGEVGAAAGEAVVVLARGEVFRHYPKVIVMLRAPDGALSLPTFAGELPNAMRFYGFDVRDADALFEDDWSVVFDEPLTEPRFGPVPDVGGASTPSTLDGSRNSAHVAGLAYQRPFRQEFPVSALLEPDE